MKLTKYDKIKIESQCLPLLEKLKSQYVSENPDKRYNYLVDIYFKWYRDYLYFCEKSKSEGSDRFADEFEDKFLRLKFTGKDKIDFSYMRHTGQWFLVALDLTLKDCLDMIQDNPSFHPIG